VGRNWHGFYRRIGKNSVGKRFHLGNCGSIDQGGILYTFQDHLHWIATGRVVYVKDSLHGVLKKIVSDGGTQFTLRFWKRLHETMNTQLRFSSAYLPQPDGQTKRVNQILKDMLRACAL
jgi:hypothetical protein